MLSWEESYRSQMTYKPSKLGKIDLIFGLSSEFISRSVHIELQVSMCSSCDMCHLVNTQTHTQTGSF